MENISHYCNLKSVWWIKFSISFRLYTFAPVNRWNITLISFVTSRLPAKQSTRRPPSYTHIYITHLSQYRISGGKSRHTQTHTLIIQWGHMSERYWLFSPPRSQGVRDKWGLDPATPVRPLQTRAPVVAQSIYIYPQRDVTSCTTISSSTPF